MVNLLQALWQDEAGQDIAEYGLLLVLIAVAVVGAVSILGSSISDLWNSSADELADAISGP